MRDWLISTIVPAAISIVIAWITSKFALGQEAKKKIYEERKEVYAELLDLLRHLQDDPYCVYNNVEMISPLRILSAKLNLFASKAVLLNFNPLYDKVTQTFENSVDWMEHHERTQYDRMEHEGLDEVDMEHQETLYHENHLINEAWLMGEIEKIVDAMRADMKAGR